MKRGIRWTGVGVKFETCTIAESGCGRCICKYGMGFFESKSLSKCSASLKSRGVADGGTFQILDIFGQSLDNLFWTIFG